MDCETRFHADVIAVRHVIFAHCPRCGNLRLESVIRKTVDRGSFRRMKSCLGFPAYRCEPCRYRFFSLRIRSNRSSALDEPSSPGVADGRDGACVDENARRAV